MAMKFSSMCFLLLYAFSSVFAQDKAGEQKQKLVAVPSDVALVTIAYQPNCPLKFQTVSHFADLDGGSLTSYELRNSSTKPIRSLAVGDSIGNRMSWTIPPLKLPVAPGELVPQTTSDWVQTVPLTDELREKLNLRGPMQGLIVLMVIRVEFTDGTVYDDEKTYKALVSYVDDLQARLTLLESLKHKSR